MAVRVGSNISKNKCTLTALQNHQSMSLIATLWPERKVYRTGFNSVGPAAQNRASRLREGRGGGSGGGKTPARIIYAIGLSSTHNIRHVKTLSVD